MATLNEKLAESLKVLKAIQDRGFAVINVASHPELSRSHRERLMRAGFLQPIIKGWYLPDSPATRSGDSTQWHAHMDDFVAAYANTRFGASWQLTPEMSLLRQGGHTSMFKQIQIHAPNANNQVVNLAHGSSIFLYRVEPASLSGRALVDIHGLRMIPPEEAILRVGPAFFVQHQVTAQIILRMVDMPTLSRHLLESGSAIIGGRMVSALRAVGRDEESKQLKETLKKAGIAVAEQDPFAGPLPFIGGGVRESPYAQRIRTMWATMRDQVGRIFERVPKHNFSNVDSIMADIDARYVADAYNSLSIEGYKVSEELIERVRSGAWNPIANAKDKEFRDAMAARGYFDAHARVMTLIRKTLTESLNVGAAFTKDFPDWYATLFSPSVVAGILKPGDLAGYRSSPVYIRNAQHVPPPPEAVRDCMPALFDLISQEQNPGVRAVLGHFVFVFVHPYMDGNGRLGRFLMNYLLATGQYQWLIMPVQRRTDYMTALEQASTYGNIEPFADLLAELLISQSEK